MKDVYGDTPAIAIATKPLRAPDPRDIRANYDAETDSMTVFLPGRPVAGIHVYLGDDVYAIVDGATQEVIGFYLEAWERRYVPAHPEIGEMWPQVRPHLRATIPDETGWSVLLRLLALWLVMDLGHAGNVVAPHLQTAQTPARNRVDMGESGETKE